MMMMMLVAAAAEEAEAWTDTDIDGQIMAAPCRAARSLARSLGHSCGTALLFSHVESGQAGVRMGLNQCRSSLGFEGNKRTRRRPSTSEMEAG